MKKMMQHKTGVLSAVSFAQGHNMLSAANLAPNELRAQTMLTDSLRDGRARESMLKMLVAQGADPEMAKLLCSPPPPTAEGRPQDPIEYYMGVMKKQPTAKTPIKSPRKGTS